MPSTSGGGGATSQQEQEPADLVDIYDPLLMQHLRNVQHVYKIPRHQRHSFLRHLLLRFADPAALTQSYPYDVTVTRHENEGFGFVIISSVTRAGSVIGECRLVWTYMYYTYTSYK